MGEVVEQFRLRRCERLTPSLHDAECSEDPALMLHERRRGHAGHLRQAAVGHRHGVETARGFRKRRGRAKQRSTAKPHRRRLGAGPLLEHSGHARQHLVSGIRLRHLSGELTEHFVGCRSLSIDQPVGDPLQALPHRLKSHRHDDGRDDGQPEIGLATAAHQRPDANRDADVDSRDQRRQCAVHERSADDHVDVVQPVFEDRDADRSGDCQYGQRRESGRHRVDHSPRPC